MFSFSEPEYLTKIILFEVLITLASIATSAAVAGVIEPLKARAPIDAVTAAELTNPPNARE